MPADEKDLRRLLKISLRLFRITFASLSHHFYERNARLYHERIDKERARVTAKSKAQSAGARKRWENAARKKLEGKLKVSMR